LSIANGLKFSSTNIELGDQIMSKDRSERAEKARKDKAEGVEKDRVKEAKRVQDRVDRTESLRVFDEVLSGAGRSKECCEPCNYHVRTSNGEYQPCKMGHEDSGPNKEICADCSDSHYRPKK
jgi:hypothetical protein